MRVNGHDLMREIAKRNGISTAQMTSGKRSRIYSWPRQEAMYELYVKCPHLSIPAIASIVGVADHTSVRHGIKAHAERISVPSPLMGTPSQRGWLWLCATYQQAMRQAA